MNPVAFMKRYFIGLATLAVLAGGVAAFAAGGASTLITPVTGSMTVPITSGTLAADATIDTLAAYVPASLKTSCSGTTTATCQGARNAVSVTGLSTAANGISAAMTVTNAAVVSASYIVQCQVNGYAGTGVPVIVNVTPGTGSYSFQVQNVSTGAALNATVVATCEIVGG